MTMTEEQKRRHIRHTIRNVTILVVFLAIIGLLYFNRDAWIPKLEGSLSTYDAITQNDGELAEGNFPLTITGSSGYQADLVSDTLFILHDSYLDIYSLHGDAQDTRQHAYQNAAMATSGKYALIYERGGTSFRLDGKSKNIYSKTIEDNIISGTVSSGGTVALLTESDSYACAIVVYDSTGARLYQRGCTEHVVDICFHDDDAGCYFTTIDAQDGVLQSTVTSILFQQKDDQWTTLPLDSMTLTTSLSSSGTLCLIGDEAMAYYSKNGEILGSYTYSGTLVAASAENGRAAILLEDEQQRQMSLLLFDSSADDPVILSVDASAQDVEVSDGDAYVMCADNITSYDFSGTAIATVSLEGSYTSFLKQDGYIFLLGYSQIDRIDFKE